MMEFMFVVIVTETEEAKSSILEIFLNAVVAIAQLVAQSSYIGTNIIMMVSKELWNHREKVVILTS